MVPFFDPLCTYLHDAVPAHLVLVSTEWAGVVVALHICTDVCACLVDERRRVGNQVLEQHRAERRDVSTDDWCSQQPVVGVMWVVVLQHSEPRSHRQ